MESYNCPICNNVHYTLIQYPTAICNMCIEKYGVENSEGQRISFHFLNSNEGFYCKNNETNILYFDEHMCFVNDTKCIANVTNAGSFVICTLE